MISNAFKKQLIINYYNTQLLPVTNDNMVYTNSIEPIKGIKNFLLFKSNNVNKLSELDYQYKYKDNIIDDDIQRFLLYLTTTFFSIYYDSINKNFNIQERIFYNIKSTLETKHNIDKYKDYVKYLEDIYDQ